MGDEEPGHVLPGLRGVVAETMTKASGQISLFMILALWLCQGWLRPQATESCTQSNSARAA